MGWTSFKVVLTFGLVLLCPVVRGPGQIAAGQAPDTSLAQLIQAAQAHLERGELAQAIELLTQVLANDEKHKPARLALINSLIQLMRLAEAARHAAILHQQFPAETEALYLQAVIAFRQGQIEQSRALAKRCLTQGDRRAEVYKLLALAEYLLQQFDQFEAHMRAALQQNPRDEDAHYHLGRHLYERNRLREAFDSFQMVLRLHPGHYKAHYYLGLCYQAMNEMTEAKEQFLAAIKLIDQQQVRYAWPFADLGRRLIDEGDFERGLGWLYRARRNDPASPVARFEYARALFQQNATPEVKQLLLEAIALDPGYSEAYYLLARYYVKTGERQLASETFARFEELKKKPVPSPYGLRRQ